MTAYQIQILIRLTNLCKYADTAFDNPSNTLALMQAMVADYKNCAEYQDLLYERGCFTNADLMREYDNAETQMQLYKLILAELPKYL